MLSLVYPNLHKPLRRKPFISLTALARACSGGKRTIGSEEREQKESAKITYSYQCHKVNYPWWPTPTCLRQPSCHQTPSSLLGACESLLGTCRISNWARWDQSGRQALANVHYVWRADLISLTGEKTRQSLSPRTGGLVTEWGEGGMRRFEGQGGKQLIPPGVLGQGEEEAWQVLRRRCGVTGWGGRWGIPREVAI